MKTEVYATYVKYPTNKRFHRVTVILLTKTEAQRVAKILKNIRYTPKGTKVEVRKVK